RQANESLRTVFEGAVGGDGPAEAFPFPWGGGGGPCTPVVLAPLGAYGRIRSHPPPFGIPPGPNRPAGERLVESGGPFAGAEKQGVAGELAREAWAQLNPTL